MVNGSGSPKIVDTYYEKGLIFSDLFFSRKARNDTLWGEPLKVNFVNYG
jgi:hypothetical protein